MLTPFTKIGVGSPSPATRRRPSRARATTRSGAVDGAGGRGLASPQVAPARERVQRRRRASRLRGAPDRLERLMEPTGPVEPERLVVDFVGGAAGGRGPLPEPSLGLLRAGDPAREREGDERGE